MKFIKKYSLINMASLLVLLVFTIQFLFSSFSLAAIDAERTSILRGTVFYDEIDSPCSFTPPNTLQPPPNGSSVYLLGDSISNQSRTELQTEITSKGFTVTKINADPGRAISKDTEGNDSSGLSAIDEDKDIVATSDIVTVALGTNSGTEELNDQIPALINKIRSYNSGARIFWVNLFYTRNSGPSARNAKITSNAATYNYSIIDTTSANIELDPDKVHPTAAGNATFAKTVADGIAKGGSSASTGGSTGGASALSLNYPVLNNEADVMNKLTEHIRERAPDSPWFRVSSNIGEWLFNESKERNINPLLIAAIGKQENGFGTSDLRHVRDYYNYFGMKGSEPIDIPGSDYKGFSTPQEGIEYFIDKVKANTQNTTNPNYKDVQNFYDYINVHQTGRIAYPGESLGPENGGMDGFDPTMQVYISWTTTDHPNNLYDGQLFNPGKYYTNAIELINDVTGLNLSNIPTKGASLVNTCQASGGAGGSSGLVDSSGYSFPLDISGMTAETLPQRHHDGTAAFDLFSTDSADVYSIYDGVIDYVNTNFNGIPGCTGMQLHADDTYYYVFLHVKNPTVSEGARVKAGQKIAEIADSSFTNTCFGSAPHLHIDRGCVIEGEPQTAGRDACRDPDFIPFLTELYNRLKEGGVSAL